MRFLLVTAMMMIITTSTTAQDKNTPDFTDEEKLEFLQICSGYEADDRRLHCYDYAFGKNFIEDVEPDNWIIRSEKSQLDDSVSYTAITKNTVKTWDQFGREANVALIFTCRENKTSMIINYNMTMSYGRDPHRITYRIDKEPAQQITTLASSDFKALGLWGGNKSIPIIRKMLDKETLFVRTANNNGHSMDVVFNISGIKKVIKPLAAECNWKL